MAHAGVLKVPTGDGSALAVPPAGALPGLAAANRARLDSAAVKVDGVPLGVLRRAAREEAVEAAKRYLAERGEPLPAVSTGAPVVATGHQPELFHPGVWVKNFALARLAAQTQSAALNLIVDNDTLKSSFLRLPTWEGDAPAAVRLARVPFDTAGREEPYETRRVADAGAFASFAGRVAESGGNWGYDPMLDRIWPAVAAAPADEPIGARFAAARRTVERSWGVHNLELPVSRLAETAAFRQFACQILRDLPRFAESYNRAVRAYRAANGVRSLNHPAPELARRGGAYEAPFWRAGPGGRVKAFHTPGTAPDFESLRPRALTLTLFARLVLSDVFLHGIGGGKYDEATDLIIADYFGVEPPAFQVLSATVHLPLPRAATPDRPARWHAAQERDAHWNPQRHLAVDAGAGPLAARREQLLASRPETQTGRRRRFRALQAVCAELRPYAGEAIRRHAAAGDAAARAEADRALLTRRDYSWVLYPESTLKAALGAFA